MNYFSVNAVYSYGTAPPSLEMSGGSTAERIRDELGEFGGQLPNNAAYRAERRERQRQGDCKVCCDEGIVTRVDNCFTLIPMSLSKIVIGLSELFTGLLVFSVIPCACCFESSIVICRVPAYDGTKEFLRCASGCSLLGLLWFGEGVRDGVCCPMNIVAPELLSSLGQHECDLCLVQAQNKVTAYLSENGND